MVLKSNLDRYIWLLDQMQQVRHDDEMWEYMADIGDTLWWAMSEQEQKAAEAHIRKKNGVDST